MLSRAISVSLMQTRKDFETDKSRTGENDGTQLALNYQISNAFEWVVCATRHPSSSLSNLSTLICTGLWPIRIGPYLHSSSHACWAYSVKDWDMTVYGRNNMIERTRAANLVFILSLMEDYFVIFLLSKLLISHLSLQQNHFTYPLPKVLILQNSVCLKGKVYVAFMILFLVCLFFSKLRWVERRREKWL